MLTKIVLYTALPRPQAHTHTHSGASANPQDTAIHRDTKQMHQRQRQRQVSEGVERSEEVGGVRGVHVVIA